MDKQYRQFITSVMQRSQYCELTTESYYEAHWLISEAERLEKVELFGMPDSYARNILNKIDLFLRITKALVVQMYRTITLLEDLEKEKAAHAETARKLYNAELKLAIIKKHNPDLIIPEYEEL